MRVNTHLYLDDAVSVSRFGHDAPGRCCLVVDTGQPEEDRVYIDGTVEQLVALRDGIDLAIAVAVTAPTAGPVAA